MTTFLVIACVIGWGLFFAANFSKDPAYQYLLRDYESSKRHLKQAYEENKRLKAELEARQISASADNWCI